MENRENHIWKGVAFWMDEIDKAGLRDQLRPFNDVLTGKQAPEGLGEPVIENVLLDGVKCDIYHTDHERTDTSHRIFIHIKE